MGAVVICANPSRSALELNSPRPIAATLCGRVRHTASGSARHQGRYSLFGNLAVLFGPKAGRRALRLEMGRVDRQGLWNLPTLSS
jgi:hypothetical protein